MSDFDFKTQFPISEYINGVINKKKIEEESRIRGNQAIIEGIMSIGDAANTFKSNRDADAKALARANILAQSNPELLKAFDTQVSTRQVPGTMPEGVEGPVPLVQKPIMKSEIQGGREQITKALAGAIKGISGDKFLDYLKPDLVDQTVYLKDEKGNITGTQTRKVKKGSKAFVVGPNQTQPNGDAPVMSEEDALALGKVPKGTKLVKSPNLPAGEADKSSGLNVLLNQISDVRKYKSSDFIGPVNARITDVKQYTPKASPEAAKFNQTISNIKDTLLRLRSGAAISEPEYKRLIALVPDQYKSEVDFNARLDNFDSTVRQVISERNKAFKKAGFKNSTIDAFGEGNGGKGSNEDPFGIRGL